MSKPRTAKQSFEACAVKLKCQMMADVFEGTIMLREMRCAKIIATVVKLKLLGWRYCYTVAAAKSSILEPRLCHD